MKDCFLILIVASLIIVPGHAQQTRNVGDHSSREDVERVLLQMERDWAKAIVARDPAKIREIVAPDFVLTTPEAILSDRESDLAELISGEFTVESYDTVDMTAADGK
jgi:hypothetical protein